MLLSLSILLLITLGLIPLYTQVNKQLMQTHQELDATHLLYEAVQGYLIEGVKENREGVERGSCQFTITWSDADDSGEQVCVFFQNPFGETFYKCETIEQ